MNLLPRLRPAARRPSLRGLKRLAKRVVPVAVGLYFIPIAVAVAFGVGLLDFLRNRRRTLNSFDRYFFGITPMKMFEPFFERFSSLGTYNAHRISQLNNFKSLVKSVDVTSPKFVFAHVLLPHPPFVFSHDGTPINPDYSFSLNDGNGYKGTQLEYADHYIAQTQFLNRNLEAVIDSVLEHSSQPPIIILQADHGPGMLTDFGSSANTCLEERFSNFSAYYLPGMDSSVIPEDITPVNLFRILFNEYFDTDLPLLESAYYYPKQSLTIYDLENVTFLLKRQDNCAAK